MQVRQYPILHSPRQVSAATVRTGQSHYRRRKYFHQPSLLQSFSETTGKVEVARFVDHATGELVHEETADALIGADGIHSAVRKHFYPSEGEPKFKGITLWRAVSEAPPGLLNSSMVMIGNTQQKVCRLPDRGRGKLLHH